MDFNKNIPTFAVLGHPNEGKSSVVSTLVEDDRIMITSTPGETRKTTQFPITVDGKVVINFFDTPGFQHTNKILRWFQKYQAANGSARGGVEAFIKEHRNLDSFYHDIELMQPLADGAAVIFVVDTSHPLKKYDRQEMEILRLIGCPRLALINSKSGSSEYLQEWKEELNRHYNIIREFNAHSASFSERIKLLEALKAMHQEWDAAISEAIRALKTDWEARLNETADIICMMLKRVTVHQESEPLISKQHKKETTHKALKKYEAYVSSEETKSHCAIKKLFHHAVFSGELEASASFGENDLFSSTVWRLLGLSHWQVIALGAATGAGSGIFVDVALQGITFGVFTAGGAVIGGASAAWGAKHVADIKIVGRKLGGRNITVGPLSPGSQLLAVLIDRFLLYFNAISRQPHARRDNATAAIAVEPKPWLTAQWSKDEQKIIMKYIKSARGGLAAGKTNDLYDKLYDILIIKLRESAGE